MTTSPIPLNTPRLGTKKLFLLILVQGICASLSPAFSVYARADELAVPPAAASPQGETAAPQVIPPQVTPTPTEAPEPTETVISVVQQRKTDTQRSGGGMTLVPHQTIERSPSVFTFNNLIAATVPGAAALPNGAIRIRGSDNQFSYYLDGAPLPANVSAFITDQFNPKNIDSLRILTGAFPAQYGGQLSAIFDMQAKAGQVGHSEGFLQGELGNFQTRDGAFQYSDGAGKLGYFLSGLNSQTNFRLSPISPEALHNGGRESVGFGKFDYRLSDKDSLIFHIGAQNARLEVPNSPDREAVGQDDIQREDKDFINAIWKRADEKQAWTLSMYSHYSQNRYLGSPEDLVASAPDDDIKAAAEGNDDGGDDEDDALISVHQKQRIRYTGIRGDYSLPGNSGGKGHHLSSGFDFRRARGQLDFSLISPPADGFDPVIDDRSLRGHDLGAYLQDDWTFKKFDLNYGLRYDTTHSADNGSFSQLSPRLNLSYQTGSNTFYAFYNRLWMPVPIESIRNFAGESALGDLDLSRVRPETDDYYGLGWKRRAGKGTFTANAYYKAIKNIVDNEEIGDTLLEVPINEAQGIIRGLELSYDRPLSKTVTLSAGYGLSRGVASGPIVGGLAGLEGLPSGFFVDDHDQTHVASVSLTHAGRRTYGVLEGQFESGLPYGEIENANGDPVKVNFLRAPSHFVLNGGIGHRLSNGLEVALNVTNLLDRDYVIAADNVFRRSIFGQKRAVGAKVTWNF